MTSYKQVNAGESNPWLPVFWCFPALVAFGLFLLSFPIDREVPFWPHLQIVELFAIWFVFVAPASTLAATVLLIVRRRHTTSLPKLVGWVAIAVSILANAFVLLGMAG